MYDKFLKLLENQGVSAYKVSQATGISQQTFTDWKAGRYTPKQEKIQKIADYFNVPVSYFYGEEEEPKYYFDAETAAMDRFKTSRSQINRGHFQILHFCIRPREDKRSPKINTFLTPY